MAKRLVSCYAHRQYIYIYRYIIMYIYIYFFQQPNHGKKSFLISNTIQTSVDSPAILVYHFPGPAAWLLPSPSRWSQVSRRCTRRRRTAFARRQRCCWPTAERPPTCEMHEVPIFPPEKWWICRGKILLTLVDIAQEIQVREL